MAVEREYGLARRAHGNIGADLLRAELHPDLRDRAAKLILNLLGHSAWKPSVFEIVYVDDVFHIILFLSIPANLEPKPPQVRYCPR